MKSVPPKADHCTQYSGISSYSKSYQHLNTNVNPGAGACSSVVVDGAVCSIVVVVVVVVVAGCSAAAGGGGAVRSGHDTWMV